MLNLYKYEWKSFLESLSSSHIFVSPHISLSLQYLLCPLPPEKVFLVCVQTLNPQKKSMGCPRKISCLPRFCCRVAVLHYCFRKNLWFDPDLVKSYSDDNANTNIHNLSDHGDDGIMMMILIFGLLSAQRLQWLISKLSRPKRNLTYIQCFCGIHM